MGDETDRILLDETLPPGRPWASVIDVGQVLRIMDVEGRQAADFLCYNAERPEERYHAPNTIKAGRSVQLTTGHVLYSDEARPMFTIIADSAGGHDTIGGCCNASSNELLYGVRDCPGCRENFLEALTPYGLGRRDIVPNVNFFCNVPVGENGRLADTVFAQGHSSAGACVELRAEMRALAVVSNCPQVHNPCNDVRPSPLRLLVLAQL